MKKLKVLMVSDAKPGHMTQSLGLLHYLGKHFSLEDSALKIKPRIKIANRLFAKLLNKNSRFSEIFFNLFYRIDNPQILSNQFDLIVSTGGNTCGVNAFLAKKYGCRNLFLGSLRQYSSSLFTAVISTAPIPGVKNSIILNVAPTLINRKQMEYAASEFIQSNPRIEKRKPYWIMLIGGDGSGYYYDSEDYKRIAESMLKLAKEQGINWLLTTSRRTGVSNEKVMQSVLKHCDEIAHAVFFSNKAEKVMQAYLGLGDFIFCTEDSTSMVSEAVISQKPVITLRGRIEEINKGHKAVIKRFTENDMICRSTIDELQNFSPEGIKHRVIDPYKNYDQIIEIAKASIA